MRQKQTPGLVNSTKVSYVEYVEINVYGLQFRLLKGKKVTINGLGYSVPYNGQTGITISKIGKYLTMYAPFGLTVYWDGSTKAVYSLSPSYENHVCGLCGNADGNF